MRGCDYLMCKETSVRGSSLKNLPRLLFSNLFQHQRAHEDRAALRFTFYDVISARAGAPAELRSLQSRCLIPGLYSTHLERWLTHYPANQVLLRFQVSSFCVKKERSEIWFPTFMVVSKAPKMLLLLRLPGKSLLMIVSKLGHALNDSICV